ncbi:hypothetical protein [Legionella spiritensis]|uniref:Transmembrane protein n=1 Tax=Legionella spiritensis TaxID=452 RepID=A0A0W0Z6A1_LEGSP|nr:hypothetical protein [Legionella spiritensis]KTD64660.1 hypothetical protein Lspi_0827 [Legionella spiritensis]SNV47738.1 Uncharacterised protein [Legionella spiritensis]VEG91340.1 Uncharacterised protein [Legionella spiritensis]
MNDNLKKMFENLIPFLLLGIAVALLVGLFIMFSYVLIWGIIIGGILWAVSIVKEYVFPSKSKKNTQGRVIEHEDND